MIFAVCYSLQLPAVYSLLDRCNERSADDFELYFHCFKDLEFSQLPSRF